MTPKSKIGNNPKTINNAYIKNISKSKTFIADFTKYLTETLEGEYKEIIENKIRGLIQKWEHDYAKATAKNKMIDEISVYIEKNKKCKLPWTLKEVQEAILAVRRLFEQANK